MLLEWQLGEKDGKPRTERLLWLSPSGSDLVTIDVFEPNALPVFQSRKAIEAAIASEQVKVLSVDPYASLIRPDHTIPEKHRKYRDEAWEAISALVDDSSGRIFLAKERGTLINSAVERTGRTKMSLYKYLRRYWQGGQMKNALLPSFDKCGARGKERNSSSSKRGRPSKLAKDTKTPTGVNVDASIKEKFRKGIDQIYSETLGIGMRDLYRRILEEYFHEGYIELPTYEQFCYWYKKERGINQTNTKRRRQNYIQGHLVQPLFGPGSQYQIEITVCDVLLVNSLDRKRVIGCPTVYAAIDVFSRLIVGVSVEFASPTSSGVMRLLENAASDKVAFCKENEVEIQADDWPSCYVPEAVLIEQAELCDELKHSLNSLNISVLESSAYRTNWKSVIKQHFKVSEDEFLQASSETNYHPAKQTDSNQDLNAVLDIHQFRRLVVLLALEHNQAWQMDWYKLNEFIVSDSVNLYPIDLWNWGVCNRNGHLRELSAEILKTNFLPRGIASVHSNEIRFEGLSYSSPHIEQIKAQGYIELPIIHDPRNVDVIYLYGIKGGEGANYYTLIDSCHLIDVDKAFQGCDLHEVDDFFKSQEQIVEIPTERAQVFREIVNTQIQQVISEAKEQTLKASKAPEPAESEVE
ncbi:Mu transposase C-terminal domain-containing protein [Leptolyngbya sp. PL-A3]